MALLTTMARWEAHQETDLAHRVPSHHNQAQLEVLYGDTVIKITGLTVPAIAQVKEIITELDAKL